MRVPQTVVYAIHVLLRLAEHPEGSTVSCMKLAQQGKMPERFLLQILRDLAKQGLLQSTRGGGGGFALVRRPDEISLLEIIEAVEGRMAATLPLTSDFPQPSGERLRGMLRAAVGEFRCRLQEIHISDLLDGADADKFSPRSGKRAKRL